MQIEKSCQTCNKYNTCLIIKAVNQIIQQHFKPDTTPIQPHQLANICTEHQSKTLINNYEQSLKQIEENQT